jgi:hypothetical protein
LNGQDVKQYPDRCAGFDCMISNGFPIDEECDRFLDGLRHVLTCQTPYNRELYIEARRCGIKTYEQYNFEFQDLLIKPEMAQPTKFLAPSLWNIDVMRSRFGDRVVHLAHQSEPVAEASASSNVWPSSSLLAPRQKRILRR